MAIEPWRTGTVIRIIDETYNTKRFWIQVPELERFDFKAGQFVTLDLPIHDQKNKRWRSYSIASWPDGTNVFELIIVLNRRGAGTHYLFNVVREGSELTFRGPEGLFLLPETIDMDIFFICTGTGIGPFMSMLNYILLHNIPHQAIYLIFGYRTKRDLLYHEEMKLLQSNLKNFTYIPTLSREGWNGLKDYVHSLYEEICKQNTDACEGMEQLKPARFYLCGWKTMIDDAKQKITAMGYDREAIHLELYG